MNTKQPSLFVLEKPPPMKLSVQLELCRVLEGLNREFRRDLRHGSKEASTHPIWPRVRAGIGAPLDVLVFGDVALVAR